MPSASGDFVVLAAGASVVVNRRAGFNDKLQPVGVLDITITTDASGNFQILTPFITGRISRFSVIPIGNSAGGTITVGCDDHDQNQLIISQAILTDPVGGASGGATVQRLNHHHGRLSVQIQNSITPGAQVRLILYIRNSIRHPLEV